MSDSKEVIQSEIIPRLYMKLLPMQIILVIIGGINSIIDNAFAGNLIGPQAMAVTGLFSPVTNLLNGVNALIFGGAQVLCGRYLGKKMVEQTRSIFTLDMIIMLVISLCLLFSCEIFPDSIAVFIGARNELVHELSTYIRGYALGLPFYCVGTQFTAFLQLEHQEKRSYNAIITMFVVNIISNWLFVAVFKMGLFGLGLATSFGNVFFFIIQAAYFLGKNAVIRFSMESIVLSDIKNILVNGLPGALTQFCISIRGLLLNNIIQHYVGPDGLAAYSAVYSFGCIYWAVPAGVTSAVMVLGSVYVGEEDKTGLKVLMRTFLRRGLLLVLIVAVAVSALCLPITNMFFHDPSSAVYQMTLTGFMLYPLYAPISTLIVGFSNYYHCLSHEGIVRTISVVDGVLGVCLFTFILVPPFGMTGVWAGQLLGCTFCVLLLLAFAIYYNKKPLLGLDDLMCFGKDFGVPKENRIDIRVSYVNDEIIISLKDDGIPFNPEEAARLFGTEEKEDGVDADVFHNIGLQLVSRMSKSMSYQNTFGLNILTLVVYDRSKCGTTSIRGSFFDPVTPSPWSIMSLGEPGGRG
ncbi:MAG: hypothetical protein K5668_04800 [Lachnospiraceae bacterium]|nr:hypothetical protein [Lachnospiraceae bacterium]